jgi:hypothetical protein
MEVEEIRIIKADGNQGFTGDARGRVEFLSFSAR